jgi:hypothetical protein
MQSQNARLGFVYYLDDQHYTQADFATWIPILSSVQAKWLVLRASPERAVPEAFIIGLTEMGIEPIIHIPCSIGELNAADISPILTSYSRWGVRYVVIFDRPNQRANWRASDWGRSGLVERFLDHLLPILRQQLEAGLIPVLPPLEPGGDYWDTAFLEGVLKSLVRRGETEILKDLTLGMYAWTYGKPLDWGAGGPSKWLESLPYHTPVNSQDQIGFRIFDWYREIASRIIGRELPMLVLAGGAVPGDDSSSAGAEAHIEQTLSIVRAISSDDVPASVLNYAFYHLGASTDPLTSGAAWFPSIEQPMPVVEALKGIVSHSVNEPAGSIRKPLNHYVLVPEGHAENSSHNWQLITEFARTKDAVVGFSSREARMAKTVTLIADEEAISEDITVELRTAGCEVDYTTDKAFFITPAFYTPTVESTMASPDGASNG